MKIIDETGAVVENPDLTLGYLTDDTQPLEHPAQEEARKKQEAKDKLPDTVADLMQQLTDLQLALCELYERSDA